jgi:phage-related protein
MSAEDRRRIGEDIKTVEFGWPVGMPTCRALGNGLHEIRTHLPRNRVSRVLFCVDRLERLVLLHGFFKTARQTPSAELEIARLNKAKHERNLT